MRKRHFPPVVDQNTRVLILGSLPGEASLAAKRYYAHPRNAFWRLMGAVLGEPIADLDYEARLTALRKRGVGLWDVVAEARRAGSLDSAIRDHRAADLVGLAAELPALRAVGFNGQTSAKIGGRILAPLAGRIALIPLPSSSPAYTLATDEKAAAWAAALRPHLT